MNQIHIITDAGSDIVNPDRADLTVLPMTIRFGEEEFQDGVNLTHREFYEKLIESDTLPTTSQPSPFLFENAIRDILEQGDIPLVITISSKLSGTWQSACIAAGEFDEKVYVVDSESVAVGEKALVEYALRLKDQGANIDTIVEILEREKKQICVLGLLDTLEYLQKGGRISKTVAIAGSLLSIKPVVTVTNGEVQLLGKARGSKQGNNFLIQKIQEHGVDFSRPVFLGYTGLSDVLLQKYIEDSRSLWEGCADSLSTGSIGGAIGTTWAPARSQLHFLQIASDFKNIPDIHEKRPEHSRYHLRRFRSLSLPYLCRQLFLLPPFRSIFLFLSSVLFNVLKPLVDNGAHMSVCQRIKNRLPFSPAFYQFALFQDTKLMRYRRLRHIERLRQVADAHLRLKQNKQYPDSGGIPEHLEQLRQVIQRFLLRHLVRYRFKQLLMQFFYFTAFHLFHPVSSILRRLPFFSQLLHIQRPYRVQYRDDHNAHIRKDGKPHICDSYRT